MEAFLLGSKKKNYSWLACLQRNFPCNRGPGIYYNFGINCGGPEITSSSNGRVYEKENEPLGPASYFVTGTSRWGVSNVGYFAGSTNPQYTSFSLSQFTNAFDSVLFQTARLSASSIRYFGLGLENGNYTVNLKFAEHVILAATTGKFLGRRLFDIYIQWEKKGKAAYTQQHIDEVRNEWAKFVVKTYM
ncbi:probable LRR receptor-like serine/threonine-protein kinase At1g56140 isoform X3 [Rosa chinensis]|uniref:probable LRR receptor-like serine/threonine-protein kinase At1g56140 isoform X3 n=1 Tax=Rosa chinensis TaxID=74649 RepID=UPI001AD8D2E7|nr:probable LRR receptor-like serine/threonine-protein kinase At1g56140 isoform X3 [Rosa chinensis]